MKILHVTNYDNLGGAGIAAYRLHTALRKAGVDSRMLVRRKGTTDSTVEEVGSFTPVDSGSLIVDKDEEKKTQQPIIQQLNNCRARLLDTPSEVALTTSSVAVVKKSYLST